MWFKTDNFIQNFKKEKEKELRSLKKTSFPPGVKSSHEFSLKLLKHTRIPLNKDYYNSRNGKAMAYEIQTQI